MYQKSVTSDVDDPDVWMLMVEGVEGVILESEGPFENLAERARAAGAEDFRVWSRSRSTFVVQRWPVAMVD